MLSVYICNFNLWRLQNSSDLVAFLPYPWKSHIYWQSLERIPNLSNFLLNLGLNCANILFEANFPSHLEELTTEALNTEVVFRICCFWVLGTFLTYLFVSGENSVWWVDEWSPSWTPRNELCDSTNPCLISIVMIK